MNKRVMRLNILFLIPACFFIVILFAPFGNSEEYVEYTKLGDKVPSFSITTLDGKTINIDALKGKVVLLNFWASSCPPCKSELPRIQKEIWQKYKGRNFEMIAIAREETTSKNMAAYREKNKYSFPIALDPKRDVYGKFANGQIPRNYVIDPEGKIVFQSKGYNNDDFGKMINAIEKELAKPGKHSAAK